MTGVTDQIPTFPDSLWIRYYPPETANRTQPAFIAVKESKGSDQLYIKGSKVKHLHETINDLREELRLLKEDMLLIETDDDI